MSAEKPKTSEVRLVEGVTIEYNTDSILFKDRNPEVEQSLKSGDFFRAVTYLATLLDYYGRLVIGEKLKGKGRDVADGRLDYISAESVVILL